MYVTDEEDVNLREALAYFATQEVDYLCGPPDIEEAEAQAVESWLKERREAHSHIKAVLPKLVADYDPVIDFDADGMTDGTTRLYRSAVLLAHGRHFSRVRRGR